MLRGKLLEPMVSPASNKPVALIEITQGDYLAWYDRQDKSKEYDVDIKRHRERRSLNANNLFHKMVGQIAKALTPPISEARCKNILLGRYGVKLYLDDAETIPQAIKTNIPPDIMLELEQEHFKVAKSDGDTWHYYRLKHTADYDSKEFSVLLDGTLEDAAELGIDTVSEDEKRRALELWGLMYD